MVEAYFVLDKDSNISSASVSGHALSAKKGCDIVCAAISAQVGLVELGLKGLVKEGFSFLKEKELVEIRCTKDKRVQVLAQSLYLGLKSIEKSYPKALCVNEKLIL